MINTKISTPTHIIFKLLKGKHKDKILRKQLMKNGTVHTQCTHDNCCYTGNNGNLKTMEQYKVLKKKTVFHIQQKYPSRIKMK